MKCHYRSANGRLVFEIEGGDQKTIFEGVADLQEVFEADDKCGICGGSSILFRVREVQGNKYYEYRCITRNAQGYICNAQLSFGQNKIGGSLFPKRQDKEGNWLPNRGWYKYTPKEDK